MKKNIEIAASKYEEMRKNPLFFLKFFERIHYDERGYEYDDSEWCSIDRDLGIRFRAGKFGNRSREYCLCRIDGADYKTKDDGSCDESRVIMHCHAASSDSDSDCFAVISNCLYRSRDKEDEYSFMELLWLLDKQGVNASALIAAINRFDKIDIPNILSVLQRVCRCLSLDNQEHLKSVFLSYGRSYDIYMPTLLTEAYYIAKGREHPHSANMFTIVDEIVGYENVNDISEGEACVENVFVQLCLWMHSVETFGDYDRLKSVFSMVSEEIRLLIVKRYMHDIRLGNTTLDCDLLRQFKDNKYDEFIRFRYCVETPAEPVILTTSLLADSLLTLCKSEGKTFQTFDGVLDFAITHCDKNHPNVNFKLQRILPTCEYGAVYNDEFKGFVDYQLVRRMNQELMTEEILQKAVRGILDSYGRRMTYPVCAFGNGDKMSNEQFRACSRTFHSKDGKANFKLDCIIFAKYDDKWLVRKNQTPILNSFLKDEQEYMDSNEEIQVSWDMVSVVKFKRYLLDLPLKFKKMSDDEFLVSSYRSSRGNYTLMLMEKFSDILKIRVFPQIGAVVGVDVFGYMKDELSKLSIKHRCDPTSKEYFQAYEKYKDREAKEVARRTVLALTEELNGAEYNGNYFELKYDRQTFNNIIHRFYFKESFAEKDTHEMREFLKKSYVTNLYRPYCAPQLSNEKNPAINLPYFWCRGKECFHNNLDGQMLQEEVDWRNYSLYHMIEILGYPKIRYTIAGNEPDFVVRNFIAITNKAMQKFKRLKCRSCGHLMFADKSGGYNRYNYYSCINPICLEVNTPVYLNFCYQCKKGLIDSRDTKQCPNKWYICPTCLSCCDDAQYRRMAQRYILSKKPVPSRIQSRIGKGHNDKGQYFCPICGNRIERLQNEHGDEIQGCKLCKRRYDV